MLLSEWLVPLIEQTVDFVAEFEEFIHVLLNGKLFVERPQSFSSFALHKDKYPPRSELLATGFATPAMFQQAFRPA